MAATAKTTAMYEASQARYDRLVSFGVERMYPESMKYVLAKLQSMRTHAYAPDTGGDPDMTPEKEALEREKWVLEDYRALTPEVEKLEAKVRAATPGGLPEEQPTKGIPTVVWVVGGLALVGALWAWSRRD